MPTSLITIYVCQFCGFCLFFTKAQPGADFVCPFCTHHNATATSINLGVPLVVS